MKLGNWGILDVAASIGIVTGVGRILSFLMTSPMEVSRPRRDNFPMQVAVSAVLALAPKSRNKNLTKNTEANLELQHTVRVKRRNQTFQDAKTLVENF